MMMMVIAPFTPFYLISALIPHAHEAYRELPTLTIRSKYKLAYANNPATTRARRISLNLLLLLLLMTMMMMMLMLMLMMMVMMMKMMMMMISLALLLLSMQMLGQHALEGG